jgi:hypothetical protein
MKAMNLAKIPLSDYPDLIQAIIDGRAKIYFYMVAHGDYRFMSEDGIWGSRNERCEIVHATHILGDLQRRYRGSDLDGISLPDVRDEQGQELCVIHRDEDFAPDHRGRIGHTMVRFPWDCFKVELHEAEAQQVIRYTKPTPVNVLVNDFLNECTEGVRGISEFGVWLREKRDGCYLDDIGKYEWPTKNGRQRKSKSRVKSILSNFKGKKPGTPHPDQ